MLLNFSKALFSAAARSRHRHLSSFRKWIGLCDWQCRDADAVMRTFYLAIITLKQSYEMKLVFIIFRKNEPEAVHAALMFSPKLLNKTNWRAGGPVCVCFHANGNTGIQLCVIIKWLVLLMNKGERDAIYQFDSQILYSSIPFGIALID